MSKVEFDPKKYNIVLPFYWAEDDLVAVFTFMGFQVIHSNTLEGLVCKIISTPKVDFAIEWQHGPNDFVIRDILHACKKKAAIFLCLNWNGKLHCSLKKKGYSGTIKLPDGFNPDILFPKMYKAMYLTKKPKVTTRNGVEN